MMNGSNDGEVLQGLGEAPGAKRSEGEGEGGEEQVVLGLEGTPGGKSSVGVMFNLQSPNPRASYEGQSKGLISHPTIGAPDVEGQAGNGMGNVSRDVPRRADGH